jgi:hypothetical protein
MKMNRRKPDKADESERETEIAPSAAYSGENDHPIRSMPIRDSGHGDQASR